MKRILYLTPMAALCVFAWGVTVSWAQSPTANGWTTLAAGQSQSGLRYERDGSVWLGTNKIVSCPAADYETLDVSTPSPRKGFFVLMCDRGGEYADVYVVRSQPTITAFKVVSRNVQVEQKNFIDKDWVSWSPDEEYALFSSGGEGFQGPMVLVNLTTRRVREIEYKHLGLQGETEILDHQSVSWVSANSFRMRFKIVCQVFADNPRCASGPCRECDSAVHRMYWAQVNLRPFNISYTITDASINAVAKRTSRNSTPSKRGSRTSQRISSTNSSGNLPGFAPITNPPSRDTVTVQGPGGSVEVKNFFKIAKEISKYDVVIYENSVDNTNITYYPSNGNFSIYLQPRSKRQFVALRADAEERLLRILGISRVDACKLNIRVAVAQSLVEELNGTDYGLSFCPSP